MNDEKPSNIFDEASKKPKKAKKPAPPKKPLTDAEVSKMLDRMNEMRREIEKKVEDACEGKGLTWQNVQDYVNEPKNFLPTEWKRLQHRREEVAEKLWASLGTDVKKKKAAVTKKKVAKKRKGKTLGARKRWIPMK